MLPLKFDGGGYRAGGKAMFDSEGNLWVGDNFTVGWQASDALWQGHATKFAPNGRAISPITTGFAGGDGKGLPRWQEALFAAMGRNAARMSDYLHLPYDQVVEIGREIEI